MTLPKKIASQATWDLIPKGETPTQIDLLIGDELVAQIKPFGDAWLAIIKAPYSRGVDDACVVTSLAKGQAWLTRWLSKTDIHSESAQQRRSIRAHRDTDADPGHGPNLLDNLSAML